MFVSNFETLQTYLVNAVFVLHDDPFRIPLGHKKVPFEMQEVIEI